MRYRAAPRSVVLSIYTTDFLIAKVEALLPRIIKVQHNKQEYYTLDLGTFSSRHQLFVRLIVFLSEMVRIREARAPVGNDWGFCRKEDG